MTPNTVSSVIWRTENVHSEYTKIVMHLKSIACKLWTTDNERELISYVWFVFSFHFMIGCGVVDLCEGTEKKGIYMEEALTRTSEFRIKFRNVKKKPDEWKTPQKKPEEKKNWKKPWFLPL